MTYKTPETQFLDGDHIREGDALFNKMVELEEIVVDLAKEAAVAAAKLHEARTELRALQWKLREEYLEARYVEGHRRGFSDAHKG